MDFIWLLLGLVLLSLLCTAVRNRREKKQKLPACVVPLPPTSSPSANAFFFLNIGREMKWITANELRALKEKSNDLIVIDCRPDRFRRLAEFAGSSALSIRPEQLVEVLNWLPANRSAVLCGASDLCRSPVMKMDHRRGLAPVYVLKDDPFRQEAA